MRRSLRAHDPASGDGQSTPVLEGRHRRQELTSFLMCTRLRGRIGTVRSAAGWEWHGRCGSRIGDRQSTLTIRSVEAVVFAGGLAGRSIHARRMAAMIADRWRQSRRQGGAGSDVSRGARAETEDDGGDGPMRRRSWIPDLDASRSDTAHPLDAAWRRRRSCGQRLLACHEHARARVARHRSP